MISNDNFTNILLLKEFGFTENRGVYSRHYGTDEEGFLLEYNSLSGEFNYPSGVIADRNTTQDSHQKESFVVFLCVAQLFAVGYLPHHLKLEGKNYSGTDKGYCDILVKNNDGDEYLIIECKTADITQKKDDEFRKHWTKTLRNGDQLFRYFNTYRKAKYLCLFAADYPEYTKDGHKEHKYENIYHIISLVDNEEYIRTDNKLRSFQQLRDEQGSSDDFFNVWKQTYKQDFNTRGLLEEGIEAFNIGNKSYSLDDLKTVDEYSLERKYNEFAVILRKHTISSHENAFDKLINLFLSKIIDEKYNAQELTLLWKGAAYDDYFSLQDRLNILYRQGMKEFFGDEVTYVENQQIDDAFAFLTSKADEGKETIKRYFRQLKYFNNNPFAFLDVHNEDLFFQNAVILKDVISMLQGIYLTSNKDNQFLGDLFEGFLNKGVHQSEGQFFSPIPIVRFLVSSLPLRQLLEESSSIPRAIDYACGSGHFLTEYARQIQPIVAELKNTDIKNYYKQIIGIEKDYRLSKVSQVAAFMYAMDGIHIHYSDALVDVPDVKDHTFKVLIANPPYAVSGFLETLSEEQRQRFTLSQYVSNTEKNNSIETFFIERAAQLLDTGGVATIILPSSILTKGGLYMHTRELLLKNFDIISICCFGPNTFGQTNTCTVALFLRRKAIEPNVATHLKNRIDAWFAGNMDDDEFYNDASLLDDYVKRIGVSRDDYVAMMQGQLTDTFLNTEIIQEYVNALNIHKQGKNSASTALATKAKEVRDNAQSFVKSKVFKQKTFEGQDEDIHRFTLQFIREIEKEKLYYYMLAATNPQPVLVMKAPENKGKKDRQEQRFLGYEWSNRKGDEGIHYLNTGEMKQSNADDEAADDDTITQVKGVNGIITPLFNPKDFKDENKINYFVRSNFDTNNEIQIPSELEEILFEHDLIDMFDFGKFDFDKVINTNIAFKMNFQSKYELIPLKKYVIINPSKSELSDYPLDKLVSFVEMSSVSSKGYIETKEDKQYREVKSGGYTYFAENDIIIAKITPCMENGKCAIAKDLTNGIAFGSTEFHVFRCSKEILNTYLFALLNTDTIRYCAQKNMTGSSGHRRVPESFYKSMEIPLPPLNIQETIAKDCQSIDDECRSNEKIINNAEKGINEIIRGLDKYASNIRTVDSVCSDMFAGGDKPKSFSTSSTEINTVPIYSNGIEKEGLYGYTNEAKVTQKCVTISARGTLGFTVVRTVPFVPIVRLIVAIPDESIIMAEYLRIALMKHGFVNTGGSTPQLTVPNIKPYKIIVPELNVQRDIVSKVSKYEKEIKAAKAVLSECNARKQAILDKYLK